MTTRVSQGGVAVKQTRVNAGWMVRENKRNPQGRDHNMLSRARCAASIPSGVTRRTQRSEKGHLRDGGKASTVQWARPVGAQSGEMLGRAIAFVARKAVGRVAVMFGQHQRITMLLGDDRRGRRPGLVDVAVLPADRLTRRPTSTARPLHASRSTVPR